MKTNSLYNIIIFPGFLLLPVLVIGQTVNMGELYVTAGTKFSTVSEFNNTITGTFINDGEAFIYAHFNNEGMVDFTTGDEGLTRVEGAAVQQLSGGSTSYFYNVLFNNNASNKASFELSSEISVANDADFNEGIVKNDDFGGLIIFEDNAVHTGVYDGSHVDGHVQKNGDDSFTYPIGDKQLFRYATISDPDNLTDTYTGKYFFENPIGTTINGETPTTNAADVITLLDQAEFWTVTLDAGNSTILLTLTWDEGSTTPAAITANPQNDIHIARWDNAQGIWVDEGGVVDAGNKTVTTPLTLDDYGIFTLARVKSSLIHAEDLVIYNGVTPNGDGSNDYFFIDGIQNLANNEVQIFNRWGVEVFKTSNYDSYGNVFQGFSEGRMTIGGENLLPTGTYFYIVTYDVNSNGSAERIERAGYLYLTTD